MNADQLAQMMTDAVRGFVARASAVLTERINTIEAKVIAIPAGAKGEQGAQGPRGEVGEKGGNGPQGEKGEKGENGGGGARGERGEPGPRGEAGPAGKDGLDGAQGPQGKPGERGEAGARGEMGQAGPAGPEGKAGGVGVSGAAGERGLQGEHGGIGPQGPQGERGPQGPQGILGSPGKDGPRGEAGPQGPAGKDGPRGEIGPRGEGGLRGAQGEAGRQGEHGRDAAEIDVLPSIDEAKGYRRGTWASHNGGLIRAARQTDPVKDGAILEAGWTVIVEGLACPPVFSQGADPRELTCAAMLTSGTKVLTSFRMPVMIYREIWREGDYDHGDVVTWGGSAWHCQQPTKDKPGTSAAWRLMVKEGARGKDANGQTPPAKPIRIPS